MAYVLRAAFVLYPLITNTAFEAFDCYRFRDRASDGSSAELLVGTFLKADVALTCDSAEHAHAKTLAYTAIGLYSVGIPLGTALALFSARRAIWTGRPSSLARALAFAHREYK